RNTHRVVSGYEYQKNTQAGRPAPDPRPPRRRDVRPPGPAPAGRPVGGRGRRVAESGPGPRAGRTGTEVQAVRNGRVQVNDSTLNALLAAIVANPDEDVPRLEYADRCRELGDDDRANLIQIQVEYARNWPDHRLVEGCSCRW